MKLCMSITYSVLIQKIITTRAAPVRSSSDGVEEKGIGHLKLGALKEEILASLKDNLAEVVRGSIKHELADFKKFIEFCSGRLDEVEESVKGIATENKMLTDKVKRLEEDNRGIRLSLRAAEYEANIHKYELKRNVVMVHGASLEQGESPDILAKRIIKECCSEAAPKMLNVKSTIKRTNSGTLRACSLEITVVDEECRDEIVKGFKGKKSEKNKTNYFVTGFITFNDKKLLYTTKNKLKDKFKYIWFREGKILIRKNDGERVNQIRNETDIAKYISD